MLAVKILTKSKTKANKDFLLHGSSRYYGLLNHLSGPSNFHLVVVLSPSGLAFFGP